jgi:hypothetical protein
MPTGYKFNKFNLPLDQKPHHFMNFTQWGDKFIREPALIMITSAQLDSMLWMTFNFEIEIRARSMDNAAKRELFCCDFDEHWSIQYGKFFCIPKECVDFQKLSMKC